jgi:hypothetical protein
MRITWLAVRAAGAVPGRHRKKRWGFIVMIVAQKQAAGQWQRGRIKHAGPRRLPAAAFSLQFRRVSGIMRWRGRKE